MIRAVQAFCQSYYSAHGIPLTLYHGETACYSSFEDSLGLTQQIIPFGAIGLRNPDFLVTGGDMFYGCIYLSDTENHLVVGPVCCVPASPAVLHTFLAENVVPKEKREAATAFLRRIPLMNNAQFLKVLEFLHLTLNREQIAIAEHFYPNHQKQITKMAQTEVESIYSDHAPAQLHNTYHFEQELYQIIQQGDVISLSRLLQQTGPLHAGVLADSPLRQMKNQFVGTATKVGMLGAIPGGMDPEQVYALIDLYVQRMETMNSVDAIQELQYSMVMDFCQRTAAVRSPQGVSEELHRCMAYIRNNTDRTVTVADVAAQINRSETYTIRKFKKELGITVGEYITGSKIEVAKRMLAYSDKTLAEISFYLCFSSQPYFQNVFKKKTGVTPAQYRNQRR